MDSRTQEQVKRQAALRPAVSRQLSGNVPGARAPEVMTGHDPTARGFEPLRAEPNGFLVHHLTHSVTLSSAEIKFHEPIPSCIENEISAVEFRSTPMHMASDLLSVGNAPTSTITDRR